jgi:hypothetical protein
MATSEFSTNASAHMPVLLVCGSNRGTEADAKSTSLRVARCPDGLQRIPNSFQRLDVLPHLSSDMVQRIQFHLPARGLFRQRGCSTTNCLRLLRLHLEII